ncbi:hypothetical protein FWF93_00655 [Candidatus Saccharibacteria bacterium]|nr:hypothetical protein [Candidatus Saccharibacteria bacterium]
MKEQENTENTSDNSGNADDNTEQQTPAPAKQVPPKKQNVLSDGARAVRRVCSYITISATSVFVFVAVIALWLDMGGEIVWKSFASLAIVGLGALIVSAVAPLIDRR